MALREALDRLFSNRSALMSDEQKTTLRMPDSERTFTISGLASDESVFGSIYKNNGAWEPQIMNVMAKIIPEDAVCLDIGANIGAHSLAMAELARKGSVYAFEPSSLNGHFLAKNIRQNRTRNAFPQQIGLGDKAGSLRFTNLVGLAGCSFVTPAGSDERTIVDTAWGSAVQHTSETVAIDTLDQWMLTHQLQRLDVVKMDVEGSEFSVMDGGRITFERYRPRLLVELNHNTLKMYFGTEPRILFDRLTSLYSHIYIVDDDPGMPLHRVSGFSEIKPLLQIPGRWWVDLLCQTEPYQ